MRRKKHSGSHENHERWLVSYADFITLLFAFFVVMFASSQTDKAKAQMMSEAVKEAVENGGVKAAVREIMGGTVDDTGKGNAQMKGPGGAQRSKEPPPTESELLPSMKYLDKALETEIKEGKVEVHLEGRGLVITLQQATFFPSGEDSIDPNTFAAIEKIGGTIRDLPNQVRLEGHTDSQPIHTARFRSNWELSTARGIAMLDLLSTRYQIPAKRFAVAGYADTIPVAPNDTTEGRARNRRVDIVILSQGVRINSGAKAEPQPQAPVAAKPASVGTAVQAPHS